MQSPHVHINMHSATTMYSAHGDLVHKTNNDCTLCLMDMSCLGKDSILANIQSHFQSCCVCWDRSKTFSPFPTIHISKIHTVQWEHVASGNSIEHSQDNLPMLPNLAYMYVQDTKHQTYNHFQRSTYGCTCHLQVPHSEPPQKVTARIVALLWNTLQVCFKFAPCIWHICPRGNCIQKASNLWLLSTTCS